MPRTTPHKTPSRPTRRVLCALAALIAAAPAALAQPSARFLTENDPDNPEGHITIKWTADRDAAAHQLQYDTDADFSDPLVWHEGADTESFISGLENGEHYFRVRSKETDERAWGPWSATLTVVVDRQSLRLAWSLFGVGGLMFLCVAGFIGYHAVKMYGDQNAPAGGGGAAA